MMKVLLADDHRLLVEGLTNLLGAHGVTVVGAASDGLEACEMARRVQPDIILMDIRMPRCDGLEATRCIKAAMPEVKIVILTTSDDEADLFEAIKNGASGYLLKSMDADELFDCLEQALQGVPPFSPGLAAKILAEFARLEIRPSPPAAGQAAATIVSPVAALTPRQVEVLTLVAQGYSYKAAGSKLGLSPRTIKYHMAEIVERLHMENRAQALAYAGKLGLGTEGSRPA
jgi:two-component system NarL family response regulator